MSMILKAGCYYKTRDGRKAYVAAVGAPFARNITWAAIGWIVDCGEVQCWSLAGEYEAPCRKMESQRDLVSEWREPREPIKGEAIGIFFVGKLVDVCDSMEEAQRLARRNLEDRIVKIRYEEISE